VKLPLGTVVPPGAAQSMSNNVIAAEPAACGKVETKIVLSVFVIIVALVPPTVTLSTKSRFSPLMVITVPPIENPLSGKRLCGEGAGPGNSVYNATTLWAVSLALPPGFLTWMNLHGCCPTPHFTQAGISGPAL